MAKKHKDYYGEEQQNFVVALFNKGASARKAFKLMLEKYNLPANDTVERRYRKILSKLRPPQEEVNKRIEDTEEFKKAQKRVYDSTKTKFLITWAQSETDILDNLLTNLEAYAQELDADIHVICGRYKNPTSLEKSREIKSKERNTNLWHKSLQPYLDANRQQIHDHLQILADVKIQPTGSLPLTGLNSITGFESCIIGHPSLHLTSLPILDNYPNKLLLTTGAITVPNYTDTKVGKKAEFHHAYGFVIVELDGDIFHVRQVQADDEGNFYDLHYKVEDGVVSIADEPYPCVVFGDLHYGQHDEVSLNLALNIAEHLDVETVVLHDSLDMKSINPHEEHDPFVLLQKEQTGEDNLLNELRNTLKFIETLAEQFEVISVASNHNSFLDRFVRNVDWRKARNKAAYLEMANIVAKGLAPKGLFNYYLSNIDNVVGLGYGDSYRLLDWELGLHFDAGANGSRPSMNQFKNLMTKTIGGHGHTPHRVNGSLMVGTLTKRRLGYNTGLSSWINGIVLIYPNGKASHIHFIKGKYTTLY